VQKRKRYQARVYNADESQLLTLRRLARSTEDGESVSALIRTAITEYLARHTGKNVSLPFGSEGGVRKRAGYGKTAPRIMLHLRDPKRLELLRLHARMLPGTHRTVGRVIRAAVDEHLRTHERELTEFLQRTRDELGKKRFQTWMKQIVRGEIHQGRGSGKLWPPRFA
jgi:hypothetical protein